MIVSPRKTLATHFPRLVLTAENDTEQRFLAALRRLMDTGGRLEVVDRDGGRAVLTFGERVGQEQ